MAKENETLSPKDQNPAEDKIADVYLGRKGSKESQRKARDRIDWMFDRRRGETALDIGCSQGILTLLLARSGMRVTCVDVNPRAIAMTERLIDGEPAEIRERITRQVADATDPGFVDGAFDTIFIGEVVEHLERPASLVHAAAERLAPGGAIVLTTPHGFLPHDDHRQAFGLRDVIDLLPSQMSVISIDVIDGYIRLHVEIVEGKRKRPTAETLLAIAARALVQQQRVLYGSIAAWQKARDRLTLEADTKLSESAAALRTAVTRTQAEQSKREHETRALDEELDKARAETLTIRKRRRTAETRSKMLSQRLATLERSATYQVGLALRHAWAEPFPNLFMLPYRFWILLRNRPLKLSDPFRPTSPAVLTKSGKSASGADSHSVFEEARCLREAGDVEGAIHLLEAEAQARPTERVLRALYWASIHADRLQDAYGAIRRLETLIGSDPTPEQAERLAKISNTPVVNLRAIDAIPERGEQVYDPVEGRIAYVLHNSLPYSSGGYATRAHGLSIGMKQVGLDVFCVTRPGYPVDLVPELTDTDIELCDTVEGVRYMRTLGLSYTGGRPGVYYISPAADILERVFREKKPSCVVAASSYMTALPALIAARRVGVPFIYEVRGLWEITRMSREPEFTKTAFYKVSRLLEGQAAQHADHVLTLTAPMKEELIARGVPSAQITLAPNSCDVTRFTPRGRDEALAARLAIPSGVPVIGYIGSFVQYEGLEHLAEACARLRARGVEFRLLLVGNENASGLDRGPITEEIARIARDEGLEDWLIMPGRVPHEEVESYYSLIDIAPFPRKPQPVTEMVSPMKPLEALAMEKAVVVSSVRALTEMIRDDETGLVFEKGSVDSLADTLARLIADPALRARLGASGRKWVEAERTWDKTAAIVGSVVHALTGVGDGGGADAAAPTPRNDNVVGDA